MRNFQHQRGFRNIIHSRPALIFFGVLVFVFTWNIFSFIGKMELTRENRKIAENKLLELEDKKERLVYNIAKLETDQGVEESIREKFGLAKEGEGVITIIEDKDDPKISDKPSTGFLDFFRNLFN